MRLSWPKKALRIYVDAHEARGELLSALSASGVEVVKRRLPIGDFVVSRRCGIELKSCRDFEASIMDGRLFTQASSLCKAFEAPLLVLIGYDFERLSAKAIKGAVAALALDFRLPIIWLSDCDELPDLLHTLASREQQRKRRQLPLRLEKRAFSVHQWQLLLIESLPGIGPARARALLEAFGSPLRVFGASEQELCSVKGIGAERARRIREVLCTRLPSTR